MCCASSCKNFSVPARVRGSTQAVVCVCIRVHSKRTCVLDCDSVLAQDEESNAEDLAMVGSLFLVDKQVDKASVRAPVQLRKIQEPKPFHLAAIDDPIIKKLASQGKGNIFTTDIALAVLMAAPRSVNSWDLVVQRAGSSLFLDIREGSSVLDTSVNETAVDAPDDEQKDNIMNRCVCVCVLVCLCVCV